MRSWRNRTASCAPGSTTSRPSSRAGASRCSTTPAGSAVAVCSRLSSARPPRHAIASTICRDGAGRASTRAASSPATSDRPRCARTAAVVPPPPGGRRGQHAVAAQRVEQLHRLVRIAGRVRFDQLDQARRRGRVHVQHLRDHGDQSSDTRQVVQPQVPHPGLLAPSRQRRRQRMRRVHLAVAVRAHQQQALDRLLAQHQVDEAERRAPGPLQVIDEHHHRPFPRGDRPQHLHSRPLRPHLRGQRIPRIRRHRQQRRELRHHRGQQTRVRARPPPRSARGPRPARPPARPATADPAHETPDRPRRTPDPAGTGRTCRPRTSRPGRSPPAAAHRPAPSCPPPAPRRPAPHDTGPPARPRTPPPAPPPRHRGPPAATAAAAAAEHHARRPAAQPPRRGPASRNRSRS